MIANEIRALIDLIGIENIKTLGVAVVVYCTISIIIALLVFIAIIRGFFNIRRRIERNRRWKE